MKSTNHRLLFFLTLILCIYTGTTNAQSSSHDKFVLMGKAAGRKAGTVHLGYYDKDRQLVQSETNLKNGNFQFSGYINGAVDASLKIDATESFKSYETTIFLESGTIKVTVPADNEKPISVTGSAAQKDLESVRLQQVTYDEEITVLLNKIEDVRKALKQDSLSVSLLNKKEELSNQVDKLWTERRGVERNFIRMHPSSFLSPYFLSYNFSKDEISLDSAEYFFNRLKPAVQKSYLGKRFLGELNGRKYSQVGMIAPDFERPDYKGHSFRLSSLRNKNYVLLDFWASWCVPCREISPLVNSLYSRYQKQGLAIVGISWDLEATSWKKAIVKDSVDHWTQIYGFEPPNDGFRTLYSIPHIPMFILIDKAGTIIGRYDGSDSVKDLETKIEELFK